MNNIKQGRGEKKNTKERHRKYNQIIRDVNTQNYCDKP